MMRGRLVELTVVTTVLAAVGLLWAQPASGMAYRLVNAGRAFCQNAELPKDAYVKIIYDAPDFNANEGPVYLTVTEQMAVSALEAVLESAEAEKLHKVREAHNAKTKPISHPLKERHGYFVHRVREDADVSFCIRSTTAGRKNQQRYAIRVEEMGDEEEAELPENPPAVNVDTHLSFMEQQFARIESQMHALLREADFARERDAIYHSKTDAMNKATIFWPIVHVSILLITGFTQANHIVQFFKTRRII